MLSVISSSSSDGANPLVASAAATFSTNADDRGERGSALLPLPPRPAGLAQRPLPERHHQTVCLGHPDELGGREQTPLRVLPADQGLDPADLAGRQVEHRLVVQAQLVAIDRPAEVGFLLEPGHHRRRHSRFVGGERRPPRALRLVERDVGVPEQIGRADLSALSEGDPDTRPDGNLPPVEQHRRSHGVQQALRDRLGGGRIDVVLEQDRELVAAEAGDGVAQA
jgi:hypothetical protein